MIYQVHENHGKNIVYSTTDAERNNKNGWETVSEKEFYGESIKEVEDSDRDALVALYKKKFGKKPHYKMKDETIKKALEGE